MSKVKPLITTSPSTTNQSVMESNRQTLESVAANISAVMEDISSTCSHERSTTQVINPNPNDVSENSTDVIDGTISHISIHDVNNNNASNVNTQNSTDPNFAVSLTCNKFKVDYSKLGTVKCRKCKKSILKGTLRIGKYVPYKTVIILHYFHLECGFDRMRRARVPSNTVKDVSELDGIDSITNDEISQITKLIQATPPVITTVTTPRPTTQLANGHYTKPNEMSH